MRSSFPECQIFAILNQEGLSRLCDWVHSRWSSIRFLILRGPSQCRNVMLGSVLILLINGADMRHWMAHSSTHFLCNWLPTLWRAEMQLRRSQVLLQGIDGSTSSVDQQDGAGGIKDPFTVMCPLCDYTCASHSLSLRMIYSARTTIINSWLKQSMLIKLNIFTLHFSTI